jgi:hypothetical protein
MVPPSEPTQKIPENSPVPASARIRPALMIGLISLGWLIALALTAVSFARYGVIDSSLSVSASADEATTYLRSIRDRLADW